MKTGGQTSRWNQARYIVLGLIGAVYLLQVVTPLRLTIDSAVLMSIGESAANGTGFLDHGAETPFPAGYPAILALLLKAGLAKPASLIAINLAGLALGLAAVGFLLAGPLQQPKPVTLEIICAFLLSYVVVKHTAMPLTDVPFFGLSMSCLAVLTYANNQPLGKRFCAAMFAALLLLIASLGMRRVGLAFVPAVVWVCVSRQELRDRVRRLGTGAKAAIVVVGLAALAMATLVVRAYTLHDYRVGVQGGASYIVKNVAQGHVPELGEVVMNMPGTKIPHVMQIALRLAGVVLLLSLMAGLWRSGRIGAIEVYFLAYTGIIFIWPYVDARFWLPVLPLIMVYARRGILMLPSSSPVRWSLIGYKLVFAGAGLAALGYTTRLTFSGQDFPNRYASGTLRASYCAALKGCPGGYDGSQIDPKVLHILLTYR